MTKKQDCLFTISTHLGPLEVKNRMKYFGLMTPCHWRSRKQPISDLDSSHLDATNGNNFCKNGSISNYGLVQFFPQPSWWGETLTFAVVAQWGVATPRVCMQYCSNIYNHVLLNTNHISSFNIYKKTKR